MKEFKFFKGDKQKEYTTYIDNYSVLEEIETYLDGLSPHVSATVRLYMLEAKVIIDEIPLYEVNRVYIYAIIRNIISRIVTEGGFTIRNERITSIELLREINVRDILFNFNYTKTNLETELQQIFPNIDSHAEMCRLFCENYLNSLCNYYINERF